MCSFDLGGESGVRQSILQTEHCTPDSSHPQGQMCMHGHALPDSLTRAELVTSCRSAHVSCGLNTIYLPLLKLAAEPFMAFNDPWQLY